MIPKGLYTIWNLALLTPGFGGTFESLTANFDGVSPVGTLEGGQNVFRASASGEGQVSATTPGGSPLYELQADPETGDPVPTGTLGKLYAY